MNYAGIGSRQTPEDVLDLMRAFAVLMADGHTLRSGHADGADLAFEEAAVEAGGDVEIYLPWPTFNGGSDHAALTAPTHEAFELAAEFHPRWSYLGRGARLLHARNCHQILGKDLDDPVSLVVCWTPDGSRDGTGNKTGGTGQALRIAAANRILVFNLANRDDEEAVLALW